MKKLIVRLVFPLTMISFVTFSKWWYVLVVDGPDEILFGFPLPYLCPGWHTSLSLQIFIAEFLANILAYFSFWFVLFFCYNRFVAKITVPRALSIILLSASGLVVAGMMLVASNPDNVYSVSRGFDMEIMETGYKFIWQEQPRPDLYKCHPERK